jgi:hypothetical protein
MFCWWGSGMLKDMKSRKHLKPGQNGTKRVVGQYGDALLCVRYRYDDQNCKQYKTVEIIVCETPWTPPPAKFPDSTLVGLKIGVNETSFYLHTWDVVKGLKATTNTGMTGLYYSKKTGILLKTREMLFLKNS